MDEGLITKEVGQNILRQLDALDRLAEESKRLKRETMDGCRLAKGLEVFSADDPFYSVVIFDPQLNDQMVRCDCRQRSDRRKTYMGKIHKSLLYKSQFQAFINAVNRHDKKTEEMTCKLNEVEKVKAERVEMRLELMDGMAIFINKENPHGAQLKMESKRFKKGKK